LSIVKRFKAHFLKKFGFLYEPSTAQGEKHLIPVKLLYTTISTTISNGVPKSMNTNGGKS